MLCCPSPCVCLFLENIVTARSAPRVLAPLPLPNLLDVSLPVQIEQLGLKQPLAGGLLRRLLSCVTPPPPPPPPLPYHVPFPALSVEGLPLAPHPLLMFIYFTHSPLQCGWVAHTLEGHGRYEGGIF